MKGCQRCRELTTENQELRSRLQTLEAASKLDLSSARVIEIDDAGVKTIGKTPNGKYVVFRVAEPPSSAATAESPSSPPASEGPSGSAPLIADTLGK